MSTGSSIAGQIVTIAPFWGGALTKTVFSIARELDRNSRPYAIGDLQKLRKKLKGRERRAGSNIFAKSTTKERWAVHYGGRSELRFNIGIEDEHPNLFRFGVAFSLETSRALPRIDPLVPKIARFNEYLAENATAFSDMRMWHYFNHQRSSTYAVGMISPELVHPDTFIFMGLQESLDDVSPHLILSTFDRLLPLYVFVEDVEGIAQVDREGNELGFKPGLTSRAAFTSASYPERTLNVRLRHNVIQELLYPSLVAEYGEGNVGSEQRSVAGTRIDLVVKVGSEFQHYEIKTNSSAKDCIRLAIGQLLE